MSVSSIVDRIALIENGSLLAFGSHADIYASSERYRHLYDMQASGYGKAGTVVEDDEQDKG